MTTTMAHQGEVEELLDDEGLRDDVQVMVGGASTSPEWRDEIGGGGCADAAVQRVQDPLEEGRVKP